MQKELISNLLLNVGKLNIMLHLFKKKVLNHLGREPIVTRI